MKYIYVFLAKNLILPMDDEKLEAGLNLPARGIAPETPPRPATLRHCWAGEGGEAL